MTTAQFPTTFTHACTNTERRVPAPTPVVNGFKIVRCDCGDSVFVGPLSTLAQLRDAAVGSLEQAIVDARNQGVPVTTIASDAGLSRQAIYDILRRH